MDMEFLQENLCQECLDNMLEVCRSASGYGKRKNRFPFVLVAFKSLEIYPLQDWYAGLAIRDYWVKIIV